MTTYQELSIGRAAAVEGEGAADLGGLLVRAAARFPEHGVGTARESGPLTTRSGPIRTSWRSRSVC